MAASFRRNTKHSPHSPQDLLLQTHAPINITPQPTQPLSPISAIAHQQSLGTGERYFQIGNQTCATRHVLLIHSFSFRSTVSNPTRPLVPLAVYSALYANCKYNQQMVLKGADGLGHASCWGDLMQAIRIDSVCTVWYRALVGTRRRVRIHFFQQTPHLFTHQGINDRREDLEHHANI